VFRTKLLDLAIIAGVLGKRHVYRHDDSYYPDDFNAVRYRRRPLGSEDETEKHDVPGQSDGAWRREGECVILKPPARYTSSNLSSSNSFVHASTTEAS